MRWPEEDQITFGRQGSTEFLGIPRTFTENGVDAGWRGEDVPRREPCAIVALPVGHDAARLAHDQRARGHVPRPEPQLEEAVEHAFGGPTQVEAGAADTPEILEPRDRGVEHRE